MGMKVKEWGPEAWKFLHTLTFYKNGNFSSADNEKWSTFVKTLSSVLPCIYCRSSVKQYIRLFPVNNFKSMHDVQSWLYHLHGFVNMKLEHQNGEIKEDASWDDAQKLYTQLSSDRMLWEPPMWNFLFTLAGNCPNRCSSKVHCKFEKFWSALADVHPDSNFIKEYIKEYPITTENRVNQVNQVEWVHNMSHFLQERNGTPYTCDPLVHVHAECANRRVGKEDFKVQDTNVQRNIVKDIIADNINTGTVQFTF